MGDRARAAPPRPTSTWSVLRGIRVGLVALRKGLRTLSWLPRPSRELEHPETGTGQGPCRLTTHHPAPPPP